MMAEATGMEALVQAALAGLKDFQKATVDEVHRRLFQEGQKHMLVADEVGLGKTIVAKGVIAKELRARLATGAKGPFKVTYICSNQVIAGENIRKLNLFPEQEVIEREARRIAFLAYRPNRKSSPFSRALTLNTLTPGTSFNSTCYPGIKEERAILYCLLCHDKRFLKRKEGLAILVKGSVQKSAAEWMAWMDGMGSRELRPDLPTRFLKLAAEQPLPLRCDAVKEAMGCSEGISLLEAAFELAGRLGRANPKRYRTACHQLVGSLRKLLIKACLDYVDADLFILDEFQRFRGLIDPDGKEEEALVARQVFQQHGSRILLLSATPFKAFTGDLDLAKGEDHFGDFRTVLRFLLEDNKGILRAYDDHREALYRQLLDLEKGNLEVSVEHREAIETILRGVICRTERNNVATNPHAMISDRWKTETLPFGARDIGNFKETDRLAEVISRLDSNGGHAIGSPVEYCKSAPFPLSFLDGYVLKKVLAKLKRHPELRKALASHRQAWLDTSGIQTYQLGIGDGTDATSPTACGHARLSQLLDVAVGTQGATLLWIPPSLPYYPLEGAFKDAAGFSKTLVFSAWVMVPRMIATLVSYEVERRTVGHPVTRERQETEPRIYFTPEGKKRHPAPLLTFSRSGGERGRQVLKMSNFCLLYPSPTLANLISPQEMMASGERVDGIRSCLTERIQAMLDGARLGRFGNPDGEEDRWYWAAPLLLDRENPAYRPAMDAWLSKPGLASKKKGAVSEESEESAEAEHFQTFYQALLSPEDIGLGTMPQKLSEVLADLVLGSPAVTALRGLAGIYGTDRLTETDLREAAVVAGEFLNLYNKPESITAIRLATSPDIYWRQAAKYGGDGCLQSVLDEYLHLLTGQYGDRAEVVRRLCDTINISTASVNVDGYDSFMRGKALKMRCHYAVEFGNQKIETEEGEQRASSIRSNFNSPFRPFVLATTSIGQEGLDFHQYCRRIMHWNLPSNPIDLEQREGRINRYKGLVVRQQLAKRYAQALREAGFRVDPWEKLFQLADLRERIETGKCELVPYWHTDTEDFFIERLVPMYPFSKDQLRLEKILKTLAIYRLAFGQPRQTELVEHLLAKNLSPEEVEEVRKRLMINLSPMAYQKPATY